MNLSKLPALTGAEAFRALSDLVRGDHSDMQPTFENPAHSRLANAVGLIGRGVAGSPSAGDLANLVRHVLRNEAQQPYNNGSTSLLVPRGAGWPTPDMWQQVGVDAVAVNGGFALEARPWRPSWLPDVPDQGVDGAAAAAHPRRLVADVPADPLLSSSHGFVKYRSRAQRAAVRAALKTPPGGTAVVLLPTGEGKSLVFQLLARYLPPDPKVLPGVTLVITPTTALALDQGRAAVSAGFPAIPRVYVGAPENAEDNRRIWDGISSGTQGLCFASPEAACGGLRTALLRAARAGNLHAIVLDEAHMVDSWGSNFRPYFQLLAGLRREMLAIAPPESQPRTMLLSATITSDALSTLRALFATDPDGNPTPFALCGGVRLRPEIELWNAEAGTVAEQQAWVLEALRHLPRPAILYVTRVQSAEGWLARLRSSGYTRLACVTGSTRFTERLDVVDRWRDGTLDIVVATSAFGLGIDYPHVRTIIHACLPESLDRFYQEIGRAGRDGCASASLLVPWRDLPTTSHPSGAPISDDFSDAKGLSARRLITVERGLQRWTAMFRTARYLGDNRCVVALHEPPGNSQRDIDMVGPGNTMWNARTIALMASAGLVALEALSSVPPSLDAGSEGNSEQEPIASSDDVTPVFSLPGNDEPTDEDQPAQNGGESSHVRELYQVVRIIDHGHAKRVVWNRRVSPLRTRLEAGSRASLQAIESLVAPCALRCAAGALFDLYHLPASEGLPEVVPARACGGCPTCRRNRVATHPQPSTPLPYPWAPIAPATAHSLVDANKRLLVMYPAELSPADKRRLSRALTILARKGFHQFYILPSMAVDVTDLQRTVQVPLFVTDEFFEPPIPNGPMVYVIPPRVSLTRAQFEGERGEPSVYVLPADFEDPMRPGELFSRVYNGRIVSINNLLVS